MESIEEKYGITLYITHTIRLFGKEKYLKVQHVINIVYSQGNSCIKLIRTNIKQALPTPIFLAI